MTKLPSLGDMREVVEIQHAIETQRASGQIDRSWVTLAIVRGSVRPLSGSDLWLAQQVRSQVTYRVTIRYWPGLTSRHRLLVDGKSFNIESVLNPDGRKRFMECLCTQEV